jgi:CheY-like chemotaxis protein
MTDTPVTILLAEDNKANQFISKAMLETLGARVLIAERRPQARDRRVCQALAAHWLKAPHPRSADCRLHA